MICAVSNPAYLLEQYEALRREAVLADLFGRGHGLALLISRGMMAWIAALSALGSLQPVSQVPEQSATSGIPSWPSFPRSDLTHVLADMVLTCSQEIIR